MWNQFGAEIHGLIDLFLQTRQHLQHLFCLMRHSVCRIIGFDDLGNSDDFQTAVLERRLQSSGKMLDFSVVASFCSVDFSSPPLSKDHTINFSTCHYAYSLIIRFYAQQHICYIAYMPRKFHPSVCPSVQPSVTCVYCIKTAEHIIELLSLSDRPIILVPSTLTTPWPHFIIDVGLVQRGYSILSPVFWSVV